MSDESHESSESRGLRDIASSLGAIFGVLAVLTLVVMSGRWNCQCETEALSERQCISDCGRRGQDEKPRYHSSDGECWCFDEKTGQSARIW